MRYSTSTWDSSGEQWGQYHSWNGDSLILWNLNPFPQKCKLWLGLSKCHIWWHFTSATIMRNQREFISYSKESSLKQKKNVIMRYFGRSIIQVQHSRTLGAACEWGNVLLMERVYAERWPVERRGQRASVNCSQQSRVKQVGREKSESRDPTPSSPLGHVHVTQACPVLTLLLGAVLVLTLPSVQPNTMQ